MEKNKKIFLISNADSTFTKGFICNVLLRKYNQNGDIYLASGSNRLFESFYNEKNINVNVMYKNKFISKIPFVRTLGYIFNVIKEIKKYKPDVIIVNYAFAYLMCFLAKLNLKVPVILVYWGSDLFRISNFQKKISKKMVKKADEIIVLTNEMKKTFIEFYGKDIVKKLNIIDFGVSSFEYIDEAKKNVENTYFYNKIPKNKIILTIGYNSRVEQQHKMILTWLNNSKSFNKNDYFIVIPATYPLGNEKYIESIEKYLENNFFNYLIVKEYMNETQIASLCALTNIFIHAQTTDSLSTSMIEHLYAGNAVLNGSWLKYSFLDQLKIKYFKFSDEESFNKKMSLIINNCKEKNIKNRNILLDKCSWDMCFNKWDKVLDGILK